MRRSSWLLAVWLLTCIFNSVLGDAYDELLSGIFNASKPEGMVYNPNVVTKKSTLDVMVRVRVRVRVRS